MSSLRPDIEIPKDMNRRHFFHQLASGLIAASAPSLFLPKLIKPAWKVRLKYQYCGFLSYDIALPLLVSIQTEMLSGAFGEDRPHLKIKWRMADGSTVETTDLIAGYKIA